jgi:ankyrin repeat protein
MAYEAVRAGNRRLAYELIKNMVKYPNFGFNNLHEEVLSDDAELAKVLKVSVTKKANTNKDITPLHCACINPNPKFLKAMLETGPDLQTPDADLRRAVHYAAACINSEPLEVLIQAGAILWDVDNQKRNCLHIAAMTGKAHNAKIILQHNSLLLNNKDKKGMNAMAYACKYGYTEVVKVLLEFKARINAGCGL